jgi:integrase
LKARRRRSQLGSLRLEGATWSLRYRELGADPETGRPTRREREVKLGTTSTLRSRAAARRAADLIVERVSPALVTRGTRLEVREYLERRYLPFRVALAKPGTRAVFASYARKWIAPAFSGRFLHEVDNGAAQEFIARLAGAGLVSSTIRSVVALLKRMLEAAIAEGYAASSLDKRSLTFPAVSTVQAAPRCFTIEESRRIIAAAEQPWRALYQILAATGLRIGEVLALEWRHCDFANRRLLIRQGAARGRLQTLKSKNSRADVEIPEQLVEALQLYRAVHRANAENLLFPSPRGGPLGADGVRSYHFAPLLKRLGIAHGGFHAFRHGHATNLFAAGASAPTVRQMLRHGDIRTTLRYTHTTDADRRAASDAIGQALGSVSIEAQK